MFGRKGRATKGKTGGREASVRYFEVERPSGGAVCSDNNCPCPEDPIPRGTGYIYISPDVVDFRKDYPSVAEARAQLQRMQAEALAGGTFMIIDSSVHTPTLVCERGARLRNLDLEVAAADARHWWETGMVPLRPTPHA